MKIIKDNKLLLKILSALIAIVLWFAITYTEDPAVSQIITDINTVFSGEGLLHERGLTIVNKDELPALSAVIRGNRSKVISSLGVVSAIIDVSNISQPGAHEILLQYRYPSDSVMLTKTKASTIQVEIEKILSRDIPIKVETTTPEKDSLTLVESESSSETLTVRGAQSVVEKIAYAKATVDPSEISVSGTMDYTYKLYDKDDNLLDEENILSKSQHTVLITNTVYKKAELPVEIVLADSLKDDYKLKVKKQNISKLTVGVPDGTSVSALYAVLDKELSENHEAVTLDIALPQGVYFPGEDLTVTAECQLSPKSVHELEVPVSPENVPVDKEVTFSPEKIRVLVKCSKEDATAAKISATFNAEDLSDTAEKTVPVNITAEEDIKILSTHTVTCKLQ